MAAAPIDGCPSSTEHIAKGNIHMYSPALPDSAPPCLAIPGSEIYQHHQGHTDCSFHWCKTDNVILDMLYSFDMSHCTDPVFLLWLNASYITDCDPISDPGEPGFCGFGFCYLRNIDTMVNIVYNSLNFLWQSRLAWSGS